MANPPSRQVNRGGCAPLILTCLATCALLALNAMLVNASIEHIMGFLPSWLRRPKVEQGLLFVLPVFVTIMQWWVVDWFFFQARDRTMESSGGNGTNNGEPH